MDDLISRDAVIEAICTWDKFGVDEQGRVVPWHEWLEPYVHLRDVVLAIENMPSAEPEIIRCKDCKDYQEGFDIDGKPFSRCNGSIRTYGQTSPNWFCADAERKNE